MESEAKNKAQNRTTRDKVLKILIASKINDSSCTSNKLGNKSENLLNKIRQIVYSLYQSKEITKSI